MNLDDYLEAAGARRSSGGEWILDCPFCGKGGHLYVNADRSEISEKPAGRWICFKCGEGSLAFPRLMAELEGTSLSEARMEWARMRVGKVASVSSRFPPRINASVRPDKRERLAEPATELPNGVGPFELPRGEDPEPEGENPVLPPEYEPLFDGKRWLWPDYLNPHGPECSWRCKGHRAVPRRLAAGLKLGLARSGEFNNRLIFPLDCPTGSGFTARSLLPEDMEPIRYKSGPDAGRLCFGWSSTLGQTEVTVCEGPFDALRAIQAGLPAIAILGKRLRQQQRALLTRFERVIVMLDNDARRDAADLAESLSGVVDRVLIAEVRSDPGDATPEEVRAAFDAAAPWDSASRAVSGNVSARCFGGYGE